MMPLQASIFPSRRRVKDLSRHLFNFANRKSVEMTYKTIAVHVNNSKHLLDRIQVAAQISIDEAAHLVGVTSTATIPASLYLASLTGEGASVTGAYANVLKEYALTSLATFEAAAAQAGVPTFEKRMFDQDAGEALCLQSRYSDLLVVGQPDPKEKVPGEPGDTLHYVLLHSGCPVLVVPCENAAKTVGERVVIAWNGGAEAAHAVAAALPLLHKAKHVQVIAFVPEHASDEEVVATGTADIAAHLSRHGIVVEICHKRSDDDLETGLELLTHVDDTGADLLVMGAYAHSRLRQFLLGGVTGSVLRFMKVPVLMSR